MTADTKASSLVVSCSHSVNELPDTYRNDRRMRFCALNASGDTVSNYILALDQGTTSSRAILFDAAGEIVASAGRELPQIYPQAGWVEHDPNAIWNTQRDSIQALLEESGVAPVQIAALGIANQRETAVAWQRSTGEPLCNAIVWQCRRTAARCQELEAQGLADAVRQKTGLVLDAYFSGPKLRVDPAKRAARQGVGGAARPLSGHRRRLAHRQAHRTRPTRDRRHQRLPHHALRHPCARLGRRPARVLGHPAGGLTASGALIRGYRKH